MESKYVLNEAITTSGTITVAPDVTLSTEETN